MNRFPWSIPLSAVLFATTLAAQKHPVPGDAGRTIQVFDVRDLVDDPAKALGAPLLEDVPLVQQRVPEGLGPKAEARARRLPLETLAALVEDFLEPPLAEGEEIKTIGKGNLLALGTPDKLAWIDRFLLLNRQKGDHHIEVLAQVVRLPADGFARLVKPLLDASDRKVILPEAEPAPQSATGRTGPLVNLFAAPPEPIQKYALLAGGAAQEFLGRLKREQGAEVLHTPRIGVRPLSRATLHLGKSVAYLRDFELEIADGKTIANPIVDVVKEGIHLACTVALVRDGVAALDFDFTTGHLKRPIPTFTTTIGKAQPVTIQLPELTIVRLGSRVELSHGETALFALRSLEKDYMVLLLRAEVVQGDAGKAREGEGK